MNDLGPCKLEYSISHTASFIEGGVRDVVMYPEQRRAERGLSVEVFG